MTQGTSVHIHIEVSAWAQPRCRGEAQDIRAHVCTPTVLLFCDLGMSPCFPASGSLSVTWKVSLAEAAALKFCLIAPCRSHTKKTWLERKRC